MSDQRDATDRTEATDRTTERDGNRNGALVPRREPRPWIERIGLAVIALVLATLFGGVAAASWIGGELFLTAMSAIGCLMTAWVGLLTLVRG